MEQIYLIGFMGSGKSSVGSSLSKTLNYNFFDMDQIIEERENLSIKEIFSKYGEEYFREKERALLIELLDKNKSVIATGGGVPCFFDNIVMMKNAGFVVYLYLNESALIERLKIEHEKIKRPLLFNKENHEILLMLRTRENYYKKAHYVIDCSYKSVEEISEEIKKEYEKWIEKQ